MRKYPSLITMYVQCEMPLHHDQSLEDVPDCDLHANVPDKSIVTFYCRHKDKVKSAHSISTVCDTSLTC